MTALRRDSCFHLRRSSPGRGRVNPTTTGSDESSLDGEEPSFQKNGVLFRAYDSPRVRQIREQRCGTGAGSKRTDYMAQIPVEKFCILPPFRGTDPG